MDHIVFLKSARFDGSRRVRYRRPDAEGSFEPPSSPASALTKLSV